MPTYTYRCTRCTHQFEIEQRMSEEPLHYCTNCLGEYKLQRIVTTPPTVAFKGSGWTGRGS